MALLLGDVDGDTVGDDEAEGVLDAVGVGVGVRVRVGVGVGVGVAVTVRVGPTVTVGDGVRVGVGARVGDGVNVGLGRWSPRVGSTFAGGGNLSTGRPARVSLIASVHVRVG